MTVQPSDLHKIPLFEGITEQHLSELLAAFERMHHDAGQVLFEAGSEPKHLLLLVQGEVTLFEGAEARFRLNPLAPIGELGSLTGLSRSTTAQCTKPSEVWRIGVTALMAFFEAHGDVAFPFYHNLLKIVADKVRRDQQRVDEMRTNLIRTQKAMKQLRDAVLEAEETPLSKRVCDTLEDLIEHNRRGHYLVAPAYALSASVRLDDGVLVPVLAMSERYLRLVRSPKVPTKVGTEWSGVLVLPNGELPVSGAVESSADEGTVVRLDLLITPYEELLKDHLTRVQMLDFVV